MFGKNKTANKKASQKKRSGAEAGTESSNTQDYSKSKSATTKSCSR